MADTDEDVEDGQESEGSDAEEDEEEDDDDSNSSSSSDGTAENVAVNDPEKNKKLSEITMMENLRETYNLKISIPTVLQGLHTNQFMFIEVNDEFYEENYGELVEAIKDTKFARYAGFEKGRFYIEEVREYGGTDGFGMDITLNPLPDSFATYVQMQYEAEKLLIQEIQNAGGSAGGLTQSNGDDCTSNLDFCVTDRSDVDKAASTTIGDSSANYATDTSDKTAKEAIKDLRKRFSYSGYSNNQTCPTKMWSKSGTVSGNCADISRLVMALGQVHGMKIGIYHNTSGHHYYNICNVDGKNYTMDFCTSSGNCCGESGTDTLLVGGPWSD